MRRLYNPSRFIPATPGLGRPGSSPLNVYPQGLLAAEKQSLKTAVRLLFTGASVRLVQYQQTTETNRAVETGDKKTAMKWMTKSSREFLTENDKLRASKNPERERHKMNMAVEKRESAAHAIRSEREFHREMDMLYDSKRRRFRKTFDFFKRQGLAFFICYVFTYCACFGVFYYILANEIVSKHSIFELLFVLSNGGFDRDTFIKKLEAWDTYINFGFAFILNEMLEVVRFPLVMALFLTFRGTLTRLGRSMKTSIYRRSAPEI